MTNGTANQHCLPKQETLPRAVGLASEIINRDAASTFDRASNREPTRMQMMVFASADSPSSGDAAEVDEVAPLPGEK